jgi:hypothetical protein
VFNTKKIFLPKNGRNKTKSKVKKTSQQIANFSAENWGKSPKI